MILNEVREKSWEEFRSTGLLWAINTILHLFGWSIVYEFEDGGIQRVFPARVNYRGFGEKDNTEGYIRISEYLRENIAELSKEAQE